MRAAPDETRVRTLLYCLATKARVVLSSLMSDEDAYKARKLTNDYTSSKVYRNLSSAILPSLPLASSSLSALSRQPSQKRSLETPLQPFSPTYPFYSALALPLLRSYSTTFELARLLIGSALSSGLTASNYGLESSI
ncbi:hypothetical protein MRX96_008136 [Rhipicephalus microplus]